MNIFKKRRIAYGFLAFLIASFGFSFFCRTTIPFQVSVNLSDRNAKANFQPVSSRQILEGLLSLPIETWNYKAEKPSIRHIGPSAQDFFKAFQLGEDDRHIAAVDGDGVLMAAVQGLFETLKDRDRKIEALELALKDISDQNKDLKKSVDQMSTRLLNIEQQGKY